MSNQQRNADGVTVRSLLAAIWRRRLLALTVLILELGAVAAYLVLAPRSYVASATITATPQLTLLQSTGNFDSLENTLSQIVGSRAVLDDVHNRLGESRSVDTLRNEVQGTRVNGTVLIRITVSDKSAAAAADIANLIVDVLPLHDPSGGLFLFTQTDRAQRPSAFSSPDVKITALAGAVLGIVLAVVAALMRDSIARTVETAEQLRHATGKKVLAVVPRPKDPTKLALADPDSPAAAAFRALRVELEFASSQRPPGPIVVANANPDGTDNGWLAGNLAVALAQVQHHVLVIDADFRRRDRNPLLPADPGPGLYDVLREATSVEEALRTGPIDGVTVLPSGDPAGTSTASLIDTGFYRVLEEVSHRFDAVLVLAPSPMQSEDARIMAIGGSLLLLVPSRTLRARMLQDLTTRLGETRVDLLGMVLLKRGRRWRR
jgi:capsular polysaccharide biosynthesis protein